MSTAVATAVSSEIGQARAVLFAELDSRARQIEARCKSDWVDLADVCTTIHDSELWREGGYTSFGAWVQSACPTSKSMAYLVMGLRAELSDIPGEELRQIPLGNASILRDTPKQHRNGKVLEAAKAQPPREFIGTVIHEAPDSHLEQKVCHRFRPTLSQSKKWQEVFDMWRVVNEDPHAPVEDVLEGILTDWAEGHQTQYEWKVEHQ